MFRLTLKTIRANKARFLLTATAVMLGVAFMAGTFVLTDTIKQSYDNLAGNVYADTDAVVRSSSKVTGEAGTTRGTIDATLLERVTSVPGVKAAGPQVMGVALVVADDGDLLDANRQRSIPVALAWNEDPRLNPMELVAGQAPKRADEVVIDKASARTGGFAVGDTIGVVSKTGSHDYTLAGIATYGGSDNAAGAQVVAFSPETAASVLGTAGQYDSINIVAERGVSQTKVVARVARVLPADVEVVTGIQAAADAREATASSLNFLSTFLMVFALVALLVGSFVIFNTFSITVAQRTRENALLRVVGARRSQVLRSVMFEALVTGVVASAAGVVAGIGMAQGLKAALTIFGLDLPGAGAVVMSRTVVVSMIVGTVATVVAAFAPARKAGKVAPIAAMRNVAVDRTGSSLRRTVLGSIVTLGGAALIGSGLSSAAVPTVGFGAVAVFVGIAMLGPVIARPVSRVLGAPLPKLRGVAGALARENASRNPRRTAATASALMIGIGLVGFITILASSSKASLNSTVDNSMRSDWIVETAWGMGGLSPAATAQIDALPETATVTPLRYADVQLDGSATELLGFDPAHVHGSIDLHAVSGSLDDLGPRDLAVVENEAKVKGWKVGTKVDVLFPETGTKEFTVKAVYKELGPTDGFAVSLDALSANVADVVDNYVLINNASGVTTAEVRSAVDAVLDEYPNASLRTRDEFKGVLAAEIDKMLNLVYVLLFMALVIALFGIANTLALSVFERTREIGLLRAIGTTRAQVRTSVRWESVLIALLGTGLGLLIGLGFGWAMVKALASEGITQFRIPVTQLAWVVGLAALASVAAAALPARRAARLDVLAAIHASG